MRTPPASTIRLHMSSGHNQEAKGSVTKVNLDSDRNLLFSYRRYSCTARVGEKESPSLRSALRPRLPQSSPVNAVRRSGFRPQVPTQCEAVESETPPTTLTSAYLWSTRNFTFSATPCGPSGVRHTRLRLEYRHVRDRDNPPESPRKAPRR